MELFEQILLLLPIEPVLQLRRVCRYFDETIAASVTLQRHLFFEPQRQAYSNSRETSPQVPNPLLARGCPPWSGVFGAIALSLHHGLDRTLTCELPYASNADIIVGGKCAWWKGCTTNTPVSTSTDAVGAFRRGDASWRRMLVSQPPIEHLSIEISDIVAGGKSRPSRVIHLHATGGLKMGQFWHLMQETLIAAARGTLLPDQNRLLTAANKEGLRFRVFRVLHGTGTNRLWVTLRPSLSAENARCDHVNVFLYLRAMGWSLHAKT